MKFNTAIVDELGQVMYWRSELTMEQEMELLTSHPEWSVMAIEQ